jgi:phosphoribosylformylglycinamidine (FGAM) synthase PurS component
MLMSEYHGIIIKEGLKDHSILGQMKILGMKRTGEWTLLRVEVSENKIDEVVKIVRRNLLTNPVYYAHFYRDEELIVVFPKKSFI